MAARRQGRHDFHACLSLLACPWHLDHRREGLGRGRGSRADLEGRVCAHLDRAGFVEVGRRRSCLLPLSCQLDADGHGRLSASSGVLKSRDILDGACCLADLWGVCSATHRSHRCIAVAPLCLCLGCRVVHRLYRLCDRHDHHRPRPDWKYLCGSSGQGQCSCRCGLSCWRRVGPGLARCCRHRRCSACSGGRRDGAFFLRCPARLSHCFARLYRLCGCWQVSRVCEGGARCAPLGALALGSRLMMSRARLC